MIPIFSTITKGEPITKPKPKPKVPDTANFFSRIQDKASGRP